MGEMAVLLPFVVLAASFAVVPFLGWGLSDPRGQWQRLQAWRGRDEALHPRLETRHRAVNGTVLLTWLGLLVWLFQTAG